MSTYQRAPLERGRRERRRTAGAGIIIGVALGSLLWIIVFLLVWWAS